MGEVKVVVVAGLRAKALRLGEGSVHARQTAHESGAFPVCELRAEQAVSGARPSSGADDEPAGEHFAALLDVAMAVARVSDRDLGAAINRCATIAREIRIRKRVLRKRHVKAISDRLPRLWAVLAAAHPEDPQEAA